MIRLQQRTFSEPSDVHQFDNEPIVVHAGSRVANSLVLFVHGLTGHRYNYWGNTPRFVFEDIAEANVGLYFYRTAWRRLGLYRSIELEQEARVFADALRQLRFYGAITIVGHSMGGLLAKAAIVDLVNRGHKGTLRRIAGLVLLACPQLGSARVSRLFKVFSRDGRALFPHSDMIRRIDSVFSTRLSLDRGSDPLDKQAVPTWAMIAAEDFWVDALSAGIGIPEEQKLTVRGSHSDIIQPPQKSSSTYVFLRDCLDSSFGPPVTGRTGAEEIVMEDARPADVSSIRSLAVRFFGENVTPEDVLAQFAQVGGIFQVVKRVIASDGDRRERLSGYFCLIPLTEEATLAVRSGALSGGELTLDHVPPGPEQAATVYLGAVAARDFYSRAVVLEALRLRVQYLAALGLRQVLTKPLLEDGMRLVTKHLFRPVNGRAGLGEVYELDVTKTPPLGPVRRVPLTRTV